MILDAVSAHAAAAGFDLVAGFDVDAWNAIAPDGHRLPAPRAHALGVVVGNTAALWPHLCAALARDPALRDGPDPLDRYTERALAIDAVEIRFAHRPPYPPIQRIAEHAGLAHLQPSHLCVHPVYGPWIAMRAVLVLDAAAPAPAPPRPAPCDCRDHCLPAFERAAAAGFDPDDETTWRAWVAIRDACPLGRAHRYADEQIRYHYGKDRRALMRTVAAQPQPTIQHESDPSP